MDKIKYKRSKLLNRKNINVNPYMDNRLDSKM